MALRDIELNEIPPKAKPKPPSRIKDIKIFIASGKEASEVILMPGENPTSVYTAMMNAVTSIHAGELVRVTRRFDRIFLIRRFAPFSNQAQFKG